MLNQEKTNKQFTGGNNLTGLLQCYHEVMMLNELRGGKGAYELSYAEGKSGFSFGGNQIDLNQRPDMVEIFIEILTQATDKSGNAIFSNKELKKIVGEDNINLKKASQSLDSVFGEYLPRINTALSSDYGQAKIDKVYVKEMNEKACHIDKVIQLIHNPAAKKFYDSDLGRFLLFDYHNQFTLKLNGDFMVNYLDGTYHNMSRTIFGSNKTIVAPFEHYTLEDHKEFIRSTKQWHDHSEDCNRRLKNILSLYADKKLFQEEPASIKSFGLHWNEIKGEWVCVEPIPFTGKWFFDFDPTKNVYSAFYHYSLAAGATLLNNTMYYDAEIDRLFYTTEANSVGVGPWSMANQVIIEPKNLQPPFKVYHFIFPGNVQTVGRVIKNQIHLFTAIKTATWIPLERISAMVKILFSLYLEATEASWVSRRASKISLKDVLSFKEALLNKNVEIISE